MMINKVLIYKILIYAQYIPELVPSLLIAYYFQYHWFTANWHL